MTHLVGLLVKQEWKIAITFISQFSSLSLICNNRCESVMQHLL